MKALTVCNPYPEMILDLTKRVENRTWPTKHRGWVLLHAGKSREWMEEGDFARYPNLAWGAIVGRMEVVGCASLFAIRKGLLDPHPRLFWVSGHEHVHGPWCWIIDRVQRLRTPVLCSGARGLWDVEDRLTEAWDWLPVEVVA